MTSSSNTDYLRRVMDEADRLGMYVYSVDSDRVVLVLAEQAEVKVEISTHWPVEFLKRLTIAPMDQ